MRAHEPIAARHRDAAYPLVLLGAFGLVAAALGVSPWYRQDWLLENLLVFVAVSILLLTYRRQRLSNAAYTLLFAFFLLHEIGAHYTYSEVPYESWIASLSGVNIAEQLGWQRNHYDRLIHFAYGLLIARPAIELLRHVAPPKGVWIYVLPVLFILSHSAIYELIEWTAALVFGGDLGTAYLGTQGDEWDSQKDMACAAGGVVLAVTIMAVGGFMPGTRTSSRAQPG